MAGLQAAEMQKLSEDSWRQASTHSTAALEDVQQLQRKYDAACHSAQSAEKRATGLQSELSSVLAQLQVRTMLVPLTAWPSCRCAPC